MQSTASAQIANTSYENENLVKWIDKLSSQEVQMRTVVALFLIVLAVAPYSTSSAAQSDLGCLGILSLDLGAEIVSVINTCFLPISIADWMVLSIDGMDVDQAFRFTGFCLLGPNGVVTIHSGPASEDRMNNNDPCWLSEDSPSNFNMYWDVSGNGPSVWRDSGDTACLVDRERRTISQIAMNGSFCLEQY